MPWWDYVLAVMKGPCANSDWRWAWCQLLSCPLAPSSGPCVVKGTEMAPLVYEEQPTMPGAVC